MTGNQAAPPVDGCAAVKLANSDDSRTDPHERESSGELLRLATHLQRAREEERGRVARLLHDELGGLFTAAKLDATRIRMRLGTTAPDVAERLTHLIDLLNMGVKFKRRLIEDLMPSALSHLGLLAALELLVDEQSGDPALPSLVFEHAPLAVELSPLAALTAYRVAEEALNNVRLHAQASRVQIDLREDNGYARLEISDDGRGFDLTQLDDQTFGLLALRYRVRSDGGRMTISSCPGRGTRVSVWLPLSGFSAGDD